VAHSVNVWESDPEAFAYHGVGYVQVSPEVVREQIYVEQRAIGYDSELVVGERACRQYMTGMFADWRAPGATVVLHERRGGYAHNVASLEGLAAKAEAAGVAIRTGVRVTGLAVDGGAVNGRAHRPGRSPVRPAGDRRGPRGSVTCGRCSTCPPGSR
jgi:glycine/D-amino acid oxidase-like deaminating enzyme